VSVVGENERRDGQRGGIVVAESNRRTSMPNCSETILFV